MSVDHFLFSLSEPELASVLTTPNELHTLIDRRPTDVVNLGEDVLAIVAMTAESRDDPLAFIRTGGPEDSAGWIGKYSEKDGNVVECELDMGYGPAAYYRNSFVRTVADKLEPITTQVFADNIDLDWLEQNNVYPSHWHDEGRHQGLVHSFDRYRTCILTTAKSDKHLLVWCG